jgi:hypothetical protein
MPASHTDVAVRNRESDQKEGHTGAEKREKKLQTEESLKTVLSQHAITAHPENLSRHHRATQPTVERIPAL